MALFRIFREISTQPISQKLSPIIATVGGDLGPSCGRTSGFMRASKACRLKVPDRAIKSLTLFDGTVTAHEKAAAKFIMFSDGFGRPI
jgi:hypothetical protein